jgi:cyclohexyl-isocyanide hydratase
MQNGNAMSTMSSPTSVRFMSLLFPHVTQLDMTGPLQVFASLPNASIDLVWHRHEPVETDAGFSILPTTTFDEAPQTDVLMIPGGQGAFDTLDDPVALDFVRRQAAGTRIVSSVCTGAFVLGAVGLLEGRRATTHWATHPLLRHMGATPVRERVVRDGNLITGGGVTSGIDFALSIAAEIYGDTVARSVQLAMEYDPKPPFDAGAPGRPQTDPEEVTRIMANARTSREPAVSRAAHRLRTDTGNMA